MGRIAEMAVFVSRFPLRMQRFVPGGWKQLFPAGKGKERAKLKKENKYGMVGENIDKIGYFCPPGQEFLKWRHMR